MTEIEKNQDEYLLLHDRINSAEIDFQNLPTCILA